MFTLHKEKIYKPNDILQVLNLAIDKKSFVGNNKGKKTCNLSCAFDIETSSFYRDVSTGETFTYDRYVKLGGKTSGLEKTSVMYVWQFGINGYCIIGRTWHEFTVMMQQVSEYLSLSVDKRLIVYVHNLSYEFQFIRLLFEWEKVFSLDLRKPVYAITKTGIEFRCSYLLSGYSLAKLGEQLHKYKCNKLQGDLDYSLIRHTGTPLTVQETAYCINDICVVMCYIQEQIETYGNITRLPLTKTGFVRKYCRKQCLYTVDETGKKERNWKYIDFIHSLNITGVQEFGMLQRAFCGGFTHANAKYTDNVIHAVDSYDFTSSYPFVMIAEKYPVSTGVFVPVKSGKHFAFLLSKYCCIFDIEFTDLFCTSENEMPISDSKCFIKEDTVVNNGRLVCAKRVCMTITDVDYKVISQFYKWTSKRIGHMICYRKDYLPTEFVKAILHLYAKKTTLKGVTGKEIEYLQSKEMLNACYGMTVTNPLRDEILYSHDLWSVSSPDRGHQMELLTSYNNSKNRFLFYPWGIFVTAYARRNLFTGILSCGDDYIYSDTDSVKIMNGDRHKEYFETYNKVVEHKLRTACKYHGLDFSLCEPKTIKGLNKMLGVWDFEGSYTNFKTLGAKRYMTEKDGLFSLTVSGVNKHVAIPYMMNKYGKTGMFKAFTNFLDIPPVATGKNIHTYIDYRQAGQITDYKGNVSTFDTLSGVHLEPTGYTLSLSVMYLNYLKGIKFKTL